jgi:hypothetical protein
MNDAQRYRMNAAECLSAVERCAPPYRALTVSGIAIPRFAEAPAAA